MIFTHLCAPQMWHNTCSKIDKKNNVFIAIENYSIEWYDHGNFRYLLVHQMRKKLVSKREEEEDREEEKLVKVKEKKKKIKRKRGRRRNFFYVYYNFTYKFF